MPETAPRTHEPLRVAHGGAGGGGLANGRRSTAYARRRCQAAESAQSGQLWRSCWLADCAAAPRQVFVLVGSCWPAQSTSPRSADSCPRCTLPAASDLRCCCPLLAVRCLLPAGQRATGDAACRMCAGAGVRQVALRGRCRAAPVSNGVGRAARTSATGRQLPPSRGGPEPRVRAPGAGRRSASYAPSKSFREFRASWRIVFSIIGQSVQAGCSAAGGRPTASIPDPAPLPCRWRVRGCWPVELRDERG